MKYLIALLTAATGVLHLLVGFGVLAGGGASPNWMLILNGVGYLVLLVLFWTASGNGGIIRWILLAYTLITLIGYFIIGAGFSGGTVPLLIKAIELLLAILLLLYRGAQPVAVQSRPAASATRASTLDVATPSASAPDIGDGIGDAASGAAAGVAAGVGVAVDSADDAVGDAADWVADTVDDAVDTVADVAGDAVDATRGAAAPVAAGIGDAVDSVEDAVSGDADDQADESDSADLSAELEEYFRSTFGSGSEFSKPIEYIEGIGAVYGQKLRGIEINTVLDLIVNGATRKGRKWLSDQSGISQSLILTWVNHVDLFRIKGVAQEYADLLEESGVDTVVELAQRNPDNLHKRMIEVNEQKSLVRRTPHASEVQSWVEQAKELRRVIHY